MPTTASNASRSPPAFRMASISTRRAPEAMPSGTSRWGARTSSGAPGQNGMSASNASKGSAEEARGRRVVAEIPLPDGLLFFLEDDAGFYWGGSEVRKPEVLGARMLLNGGVIGTFSRAGVALPEPPPAEEYEGRERWDVLVYCVGQTEAVPCGSLREGVCREIASRVFEAVRRAAPP